MAISNKKPKVKYNTEEEGKSGPMDPIIMAIGNKVYSKEMAKNTMLIMEHFIKDNGSMANGLEQVSNCGKMEVLITGNGIWICKMEKVYLKALMGRYTMVDGGLGSYMVKVNSNGLTANDTLVNINKT